jgi:hypothetical protein
MSYVEADQFYVRGALRFRTALMEIPASGVLVVDVNNASAITLIAGGATELLGIQYVDESEGNTPVVLDTDQAEVKFIRVAPGFDVTVRHDATVDLNLDPILPADRILTSSGNDFALDVVNAQSFFAYVPSLVGFRWYLVDRHAYVAAVDDDWFPVPIEQLAALDQLAARAPLVLEDSAAFTNGNALDLWTYALAEGEVVGVSFKLTGGCETGGVTERSRGRIDFVASRDVGGAAAVTAGAGTDEVGTITGGTISVTAVGNDVVVSVTYTADGTLYYKLRIERDSIAVPQ